MNMLDKHSSPNSAASGPSSVGVPSGGSTPSSVAATLPLPPSSSSSSVAQSPVPDCLGRPPSQPNPNQLMSQQASLQQQQPPPPHPSQSCSNSQLGPGSVGGPPSVSSAGPHTPLMMGDPSLSGPPPPIQSQPSLSQQVPSGPSSQSSMQPDLSLSAPNGRPNVSTPSSMFNTSAPNTPAMSDMNLPNIQSPALHQQQPPPPSQHPQMDPFGEQKLYSHGPSSVPPPSNNCNNPVMSPAPMSVPPPGQCPPDPPKTKGKRKASTNSNNANNGPGTPFANPGTPGTPGPNTSNGMMSNMPPIKNEPMMSPFGGNGMMQNNMNNCMPPMNGTMSPFDPDSKMNMFNPMNDFNPNMPNDHCGMPPMNMRNPHQQHLPPPPNCSMGMNMPPGMSPGMPPGMPPGSHMHGPPPPPPGMLNQQMPPGRMMGGPGGPPGPVGGPMPGMGPGPKASPMDPQYMQHQSQIFVFNTTMANQAADAVSETVFESIIDFHLAQQVTKDFMDKHNVKIQNVNKTNGNMWAMRGGPLPGMRMRGPNPNGMGPPRPGFGQQGPPCFPPFNGPSPGPNGAPMGYGGPPPPNSWPPNPMNDFGPRGPRPGFGGPGGPPPPSFNKFNPNMPNYPMGNDSQDLTPQQRQSREQKLAILQNIKDSFCPEMNDNPGMPPGMGGPPNDFLNMDSQMGMSGPGMMGPGGDMMPPFGGPDSFMGPGGYQGNPMMGGHGGHPPPPPPGMFHDEPVAPPPPPPATSGRKRKNQQNQQQPPPQPPMPHPPGVNSPNSCGPNRIPPPPYNPGLHRQMSSPHPASPATSLGMPSTSPRGQSYGPPRSGQTTPSGDPMAGIGTSPKSRSPNKRTKANAQQAAAALALDNDIMGFQHKSEPALMPVPSPKQLDYNSTFEGQELTIEKQPNMHFQENDFLGSGDMSNDIFGNEFDHLGSNDPISGRPFSNPGMPGGFGGPPPNGFGPGPDGFRGPPPNQFGSSPCDPSMKGPPFDMNFGGPGGPPPSGGPPGMNDPMMFPNGGPPGGFDPSGPEPPMSSSHLANLQKMAPPFDIKDGNMMPGQKGPPMMNNGPMMGNNGPRPMSFDPNFPPEMNDPNYPMHMQGPPPPMGYGGGPPPPGPGPNYSNGPGRMPTGPNGEMLGFPPGMHPNNQYLGPPPMMDGPGSNGPSPMPSMGPGQGPPQRFTHNQNAPRPPMNPSPNPSQSPNSRYDFSPNVQVKPNAPNTIQYLPNRPQGPPGPPNSRPPPNLDFLQQSLNMGPGGPPPSGPGGKMPNSNGGPPGSPFYQGGPNPGQMPPRPPNMQQHMNFGPRGPPMMRPGMGPNGQDMMQRPQLGPPPGSRPMGMPPNGGPTPPGFGSGGMPPMNKMMGGLPGGPPLPGQGPPPPGLPPGHDGHFNNYKHSFQPPPPSDMPYDPSFQAFQRQLYSNNNARPASGPRMPTNY